MYRSTISSFYGYDRRLRPPEGAFTYTKNLSTDAFPLLTSRKPRGLVEKLEAPSGLAARDALAIVDKGRLFYNGYETPLTGMKEGEKQLVSMGAYICIFPDKLYYNTQNPDDYGSMEAEFHYEGQLEYLMCEVVGTEYQQVTFSAVEPFEPTNGDYWVDTGSNRLSSYSEDSGMLVSIESVYTKLRFTTQGQLPAAFSKFDGVELEGAALPSLNGSKIIHAIGGGEAERDYIVLVGEPAENRVETEAAVTIKRSVPDMDYVCQCHNRLWGCFYGNNGKENLNELYASALGDFKNWNQFMGLSTDSWRASAGSDDTQHWRVLRRCTSGGGACMLRRAEGQPQELGCNKRNAFLQSPHPCLRLSGRLS